MPATTATTGEDGRPPAGRIGATRSSAAASVVLLVAVLATWEAVCRLGWISARTLPPPSEVAVALADLLTQRFFYENVLSTLRVIAVGFLLATAIGFLTALPLALSEFARRAVYPLVVALDVIPKVTLIPLFIIAFGFGTTSKLVIVAATTFFPVFLSTLSGLVGVDRNGVRLLRSMGAGRWQVFRMYALPAAAPQVFAGVKISITVAFIAAVISEFMIRNEGLGHLVTSFRSALQVDYVLAATVAVAAIGAALYFVTEALERWLVFWASADEGEAGLL
ncbi:ABC transporter permease [Geodermatophilus sp. SYSU D00697]